MFRRTIPFVVLPFAMLLALSACGEDEPATAPPPEEGCQGDLTCACDAIRICNPGLVCLSGACQTAECVPGSDGCPCDEGACAPGLACADEVCAPEAPPEPEAQPEAQPEPEPEPECPAGRAGCPCDAGVCQAGAECVADLCQPTTCALGSEGCACGPQQSCDADVDGDPLSCAEGVCRGACQPGDDGCACLDGVDCANDASACVDGYCMRDDCVAGDDGCLCAGGSCSAGLRCRDGVVCASDAGFLQGACLDDGSCRRGGRCQDDVCAACSLGSAGCQCTDAGGCNPGLGCDDAGLCVDAQGLANQQPDQLLCFTPCTEGVELDSGRFVDCPADGLMPGCFGETACVEGQCLADGMAPLLCNTDIECPDFQACLAGRCASNCNTEDDCVEGALCQRRVCRASCTVANATENCGPGSHCLLLDGDGGVCQPSVPVGDAPNVVPKAPFSLSLESLDLNTPERTAEMVLTNNAPSATEFTLTRRSQRIFEGDGSSTELRLTEGCQAPECPMWWVQLSIDDGPASDEPVQTVTVEAGESVTVMLDDGQGIDAPRWQGVLDVTAADSLTVSVMVGRAASPTGRWTGEAYYFGNFKDNGLETWMAAKDDPAAVEAVENAFVRMWANFRQGRLTFEQFQAGLVATRTESWRSARLSELGCQDGSICYPFTNRDGFLTYTTDPIDVPVPSGVVEMPMAINLRPDLAADCGDGACFAGRIESGQALQYAGLPTATLAFASDPNGCAEGIDDACMTYLSGLDADLTVGARYNTNATNVDCDGNGLLRHARMPWLLEGIIGQSEVDEESGRRYTYSCLDTEAPLPGANPVPDGRLRYRNIELVDGALINNNVMVVLFRETLETFLWDEANDQNSIQGYGYMVLRKSEAVLRDDEFEGLSVPDRDNADRFLRPIECTDDMLAHLNISRVEFEADPAAHADTLAQLIIEGVTTDVEALQLVDPAVEAVHWLCEDTGLIDGGRRDNRADRAVEQVECPIGSPVRFFTLALEDEDAPLLESCGQLDLQNCHQAYIARLDCQRDATCHDQLQSWIDNDRHGIRLDPYFRCDDPNRALCSDDRLELVAEKTFFAADEGTVVLQPFGVTVAEAFRYRTHFVNRSGVNLGFVPEICVPGDLVPYCYDPGAIEALRARVECGMALYSDHFAQLSEPHQIGLRELLVEAFSSAEEVNVFNQISVRRGFEFLDAELMIMLGDDLYTRALASRFDLAQNRVAAFEGDLFEEDGIRLSGVAGAEMHNLYAAVQYYQSVVDRFYDLSPLIAGSVKRERVEGIRSFVTPKAVETYFGRLIRASTQKTRAWADIAERYQNFNRPDLARRVIERSYIAGYLESMILTRLMQEIVDITAPEDIAQIQKQIEDSQRSYRVALALMRQHYADITDDVNYFGFAPDFIPFPALEGLRDNSFEVARQRALERISLALTTETQALEADLSFNTNAASFQAELARIENTYDAQLADICGTFDVDGQIYPATTRYADLSDATRAVGDPCGRVGNGQIHNAMVELDVTLAELQRVRQSLVNTQSEADIEEGRWRDACGVQDAFARLNFRRRGVINTVQIFIDNTRTVLAGIDRLLQSTVQLAQMGKCIVIGGTSNGTDCAAAGIATTTALQAFAAYETVRTGIDLGINGAEATIREMERGIELARDRMACDLTAIDGQARVKTILLSLAEKELEALKVQYQLGQAISNIQQARNQAVRLQQEQAETEELAINIEAARNNPNVRIYRNDAILNADVTFYSALREVYKATRVFEYYTSQSYGPLEQLFLTRMVGRGDFNLQIYMLELEDAFRAFEDDFGLPSRRLEVISLKDDILQIPRIGTDGAPLTQAQRTAAFRETLSEPRRLDRRGYLTVPFSTSTDSLSPLTRNHKVAHVEAEIIGGGQGDLLARIYLRMAGTARVAPLGAEDPLFFTFPERLAVINPFFEGSKPLHIDHEIYRNRTLVDRPYVNSRWEFVLNTLDEEVNRDLNLQGLDDIRLYVYYNDFTQF